MSNAKKLCCVSLTPDEQQVIDDLTTGGKNDNTADLRTVLKELHNQSKQILTPATSNVDTAVVH